VSSLVLVCQVYQQGKHAMSLASITMFNSMNQKELSQIEQGSLILEPHDSVTLFAQGDPADAVYAIIAGDGHVRIGAIDRRSKALMVEVFRIGDIFGEIGVFDGGVRTAGAVAQGSVKLVKIHRTAFLSALERCPLGSI
jgi:CRP-like cAMP-binding protein